MDADRGRVLPPFPTDDFTLSQLEHALDTTLASPMQMPFSDVTPGTRTLVGGEFTLAQFLDFMSGADDERATYVGDADGVPVYRSWDQRYSEHDVIRALVARIRELEHD